MHIKEKKTGTRVELLAFSYIHSFTCAILFTLMVPPGGLSICSVDQVKPAKHGCYKYSSLSYVKLNLS